MRCVPERWRADRRCPAQVVAYTADRWMDRWMPEHPRVAAPAKRATNDPTPPEQSPFLGPPGEYVVKGGLIGERRQRSSIVPAGFRCVRPGPRSLPAPDSAALAP